ncbi:SDR family NAD(P)-dependent oxidoreductase [Echinimonas agarilytica]|uniref:SDR family NAD(P)-dependent oxidoreductase n=1 Tax=Echinimonas agarilytica TaxID=1215918 RepID=A0AA41W6J3_9GAMM|nr:SDR family NAD(P)-dependent oxidoreductase [Echinimonas agarilytica]
MSTVLITGATSGVGLSLAKDYLAQGDQVIACGRNKAVLEQLSAQGMITLAFDTSEQIAVENAFKQLSETVTHIDRLVLNAGVCEYIEDGHLDHQVMQRTMDINVVAPIRVLNAAMALLSRSSQPQVALVSSASIYLPFARAEAYGASKAAIQYIGHVLRNTLKHKSIDVSTIVLGFIDTPLTQKNNFEMPMLKPAHEASRAIIKGLEQRKAEIKFPKLFCATLSFISILPLTVRLALARALMVSSSKD